MMSMISHQIPLIPSRLRHALALAEEAQRLERAGRHADADGLADEARRVCAQSSLRTLGEFTGWGARGLANGVAAVGGAIGQGLSNFGSGIAGGWTGQFAPAGPSRSVKQPTSSDTAHLSSAEAEAWVRARGTTMDQFLKRCRAWVSQNPADGLVTHLTLNGVPEPVAKYVNEQVTFN